MLQLSSDATLLCFIAEEAGRVKDHARRREPCAESVTYGAGAVMVTASSALRCVVV
jgi:hypothetical protein